MLSRHRDGTCLTSTALCFERTDSLWWEPPIALFKKKCTEGKLQVREAVTKDLNPSNNEFDAPSDLLSNLLLTNFRPSELLWIALCRSGPRRVLVKSGAIDVQNELKWLVRLNVNRRCSAVSHAPSPYTARPRLPWENRIYVDFCQILRGWLGTWNSGAQL